MNEYDADRFTRLLSALAVGQADLAGMLAVVLQTDELDGGSRRRMVRTLNTDVAQLAEALDRLRDGTGALVLERYAQRRGRGEETVE